MYVVPEGELFLRASDWLGWNSETGEKTYHPLVEGLPAPPQNLTETPRKYGFHGTIKPPFRLAEGTDLSTFQSALEAACAGIAPVVIPKLTVHRLGGFVAMVPEEPSADLADLAGSIVTGLDDHRAPLSEADLERRRKTGLSARQEELLQAWGYPYVLDEFRYHMTLTGRLPEEDADQTVARLSDHFADLLAKPFRIGSLGLLGEAEDGRFHLIHRYALTG